MGGRPDDPVFYNGKMRWPDYVYRIFNASDELIYIGVTGNLVERMRSHSHRCNPWHAEIAWCSIECIPFPGDGLAVERAAIKAERPRYNIRSAVR